MILTSLTPLCEVYNFTLLPHKYLAYFFITSSCGVSIQASACFLERAIPSLTILGKLYVFTRIANCFNLVFDDLIGIFKYNKYGGRRKVLRLYKSAVQTKGYAKGRVNDWSGYRPCARMSVKRGPQATPYSD